MACCNSIQLPSQWNGFEFNVRFRDNVVNLSVSKQKIVLENVKGEALEVVINNKNYVIQKNADIEIVA